MIEIDTAGPHVAVGSDGAAVLTNNYDVIHDSGLQDYSKVALKYSRFAHSSQSHSEAKQEPPLAEVISALSHLKTTKWSDLRGGLHTRDQIDKVQRDSDNMDRPESPKRIKDVNIPSLSLPDSNYFSATHNLTLFLLSDIANFLQLSQIIDMNVRYNPEASQKEGSITINCLPDEVLQQILFHCSPHDVILNVQPSSKRFNRLACEPLLWRHHCRVGFTYWDSKHRIGQKFAGNVGDVDWRKLYTYRRRIDKETTALLDSILDGQINRISKFKAISEFGYDAKDTLLRHCRTSEDAEDVLARRYYANAVLDHVHRSKALAEWRRVLNGDNVSIERALGAFDLFVLHDQHGDLMEISKILDRLALRLKSMYQRIDEWTTRKQAIAVVSFLRAENLVGLSTEIAYRDLQNNYIGIALQDSDHPSLPLISVAIFCALAQRIGIDARCCGVPNHVHAMVIPKVGETLDGRPRGNDPVEPMYLDPYRSVSEVPMQSLQSMLLEYGIHPRQFSEFLADSSTSNVILRTSRNILATVHQFRAQAGGTENTGHPTIRLHANPFADLDNAFYSALWANYIFGLPGRSTQGTTQSQFIPLILERFERLYPMDASLIEQYIVPFYNDSSNAEHWELGEALRVVRAADQTPKQVRLRNSAAAREGVKFKVGQVFRHRRYSYTAVITGWDMECGMTSDWIAHNQVDSLSRGRHQSFYHALVEDTSIRYVAEENIEIIDPEAPRSLMSLAGRFFKRWDGEERCFVSNIKDEYPED